MYKTKSSIENRITKECIFTALMILMEKKELKDITISEIAEKAGVSRMTYYRTYSSKEDILLQYFEDRIHSVSQFLNEHKDINLYQFCYHFFNFCKENSRIIENLYKADLLKKVIAKFFKMLESIVLLRKDTAERSSNFHYELAYKAGGLLSLLLSWVENGQREQPEEMARMAASFLE